jgi:hypothetical protein
VRGFQQLGEPGLLVAAAEAPDRGSITLQPGGHGLDRFAFGHGQEDACPLHLKEGQGGPTRNLLEDSGIIRAQG